MKWGVFGADLCQDLLVFIFLDRYSVGINSGACISNKFLAISILQGLSPNHHLATDVSNIHPTLE